MNLSVKERILLFNLLPVEGDILSLRMVRKLREDLSLTEQENQELQIQQDGPTYRWDPKAEKPKEIEIGAKANTMIADALKRLNEAGKLTLDHLDLWDKFVSPNGDG